MNQLFEDFAYNKVVTRCSPSRCFAETLRKYPPLMFLARRALQDYTFESVQVTIQKGVRVFIPIFAIQRDPKYFPNPDVFDPERFSEDKVEMKNAMYYLPFGTGPRNCIGNFTSSLLLSPLDCPCLLIMFEPYHNDCTQLLFLEIKFRKV